MQAPLPYDTDGVEFRQMWHERQILDEYNIAVVLIALQWIERNIGIIEVLVTPAIEYVSHYEGFTPKRLALFSVNGNYQATVLRAMELWRDNLDTFTSSAIQKLQEKEK